MSVVMLFLCGDVMTGRGIDQVLPHPSKPHLYEAFMSSAADYVALAERAHGAIDMRGHAPSILGPPRLPLRAIKRLPMRMRIVAS